MWKLHCIRDSGNFLHITTWHKVCVCGGGGGCACQKPCNKLLVRHIEESSMKKAIGCFGISSKFWQRIWKTGPERDLRTYVSVCHSSSICVLKGNVAEKAFFFANPKVLLFAYHFDSSNEESVGAVAGGLWGHGGSGCAPWTQLIRWRVMMYQNLYR